MKVLITGASGFIGSYVARLLVTEGYQVQAIIRESSDLWRIQDILPSIDCLYSDLLDFASINTYLEEVKPDMAIHLAWYVFAGKHLNAQEHLDSLQASLNLVTQLHAVGCQRFIGVGTCVEYDFSFGYLSESSVTKPLTLYAATKLSLSLILEQLASVTGMSTAWLRLFHQYGPREDTRRLVPAIITSLLKNEVVKTTLGEQMHDFLHTEDVASAILAVARSPLTGVVNIGSGQPIPVKEIVLQISHILGKPELINFGALPYRPNYPMFTCANNSLLKEKTDWRQKYDLHSGLQNTVEWYKNNLPKTDT